MQLTLEDLKHTLKFFSTTQSDSFTENCIVALEKQEHQTGCTLMLSGDTNEDILLNWSNVVVKNGYQESNKYVEKGAEALSFFIAVNYTDYDVVLEAPIGDGFDYWLGYKEDNKNFDELNFLNARLEVSGILEETSTNKVEYRVAKKKKQTDISDNLQLPAYISIVEFSKPKAHFVKK